ncbi:MAG: hypothetical protein NT077_03100 [Candidatus Taylorbacteria bacterium]|nr:hypothetical protein [Candidatus Taylorbacteria bacterium]
MKIHGLENLPDDSTPLEKALEQAVAEDEAVLKPEVKTPVKVDRRPNLKNKLQDIPNEELSGKIVDAVMTDPEMSRQVKEKAQAGLTADFRIAEVQRKKEEKENFEIEQERKREEVVRVRAEQSRKNAEILAALAAKKAQDKDKTESRPLAA